MGENFICFNWYFLLLLIFLKIFLGEQFNDSNLLGSVLSIRGRETVIEVWFDYKKNENVKSMIGKKIKEILDLEVTFKLYFKENLKSIEDKSTLKNAEKYNLNYNNKRPSGSEPFIFSKKLILL